MSFKRVSQLVLSFGALYLIFAAFAVALASDPFAIGLAATLLLAASLCVACVVVLEREA